MKIKQIVISEGGKELLSPKDGVIVQGCLFVSEIAEDGTPHGGLIGDGKTAEAMVNAKVPFRAFSWEEFLDGLSADPQMLMQYAQKKIGTTRSQPQVPFPRH